MRRIAMIAAVLAPIGSSVVVRPAIAAEAAAPAADQSVTLATVALPLVVDGQVRNYVFVSVKLLLTPSADASALRDKEPYFRDALVRAAHRGAPFVRPGDDNRLDEARLKAVTYREAVALVGPGKIAGVAILSQTPQHRVASRPAAQGAPIEP